MKKVECTVLRPEAVCLSAERRGAGYPGWGSVGGSVLGSTAGWVNRIGMLLSGQPNQDPLPLIQQRWLSLSSSFVLTGLC